MNKATWLVTKNNYFWGFFNIRSIFKTGRGLRNFKIFKTRMVATMTRNFYCVCRFARIQLHTWQRSTSNWHRVQRGILNRTHCLSLGNLFWLPKATRTLFWKKKPRPCVWKLTRNAPSAAIWSLIQKPALSLFKQYRDGHRQESLMGAIICLDNVALC